MAAPPGSTFKADLEQAATRANTASATGVHQLLKGELLLSTLGKVR